MTKRAVLYARVSGDDSGKDGRNLAGQLAMGREYAGRQGWQVVAELAEDERGVSGARMDAPELNRALDMARAGQFDVLIVRELDRLARGLAKQLIVEESFKRAAVQIDYVLGDYAQTPEGQLNKQIRAVVAEYEREKIRERSVRGRRLSVQSGNVLTHGRPPFGYTFTRVDGRGRLEIDEPTATVVRLIFTLYARGLTIRELAEEMRGIPTPMDRVTYPGFETVKQRGYGEWSASTLNRILANEVYSGRFVYGGLDSAEPVAVAVPAIIPAELWAEVQRRREGNRQMVAQRTRKYEYLVAGRGRCGQCGLAIHSQPVTKVRKGKRGKTRLYYRCPSFDSDKYTARGCDLPYFNAGAVDRAVWAAVRAYLTDPDKLGDGLRRYAEERERADAPIRQQAAIVADLIQEHEAKRGRLLDLYLSGDFDRAELDARRVQIERVLGDLKRRAAELDRQLSRQLTAADITGIQSLVATVGERVNAAEGDFELQRRILDRLGVVVTFALEEGERVLYLTGEIGEIGCITLSQDGKTAYQLPTPLPTLHFRTRIPLTGSSDVADVLASDFFAVVEENSVAPGEAAGSA
jgi:site-specific DNA recombinase